MASGRKILIVLPNWIGDAVMATPALGALRERFEKDRFACLARPPVMQLLRPSDWIDSWIADTRPAVTDPGAVSALVRRISAGRFDLAVLFPNSFRSALLTRLAGVGRLVGYDRDGRGWMLSAKLSPPRDRDGNLRPIPAIDYYLGLVGLLDATVRSRHMSLPVDEADERQAEALLCEAGWERDKPLVMLNPGASHGVSKMWDPDRYAAVADALIEQDEAQIIVNAAPGERAVAGEVREAMRHPPLLDFAHRNNTIPLLKSLLRRCGVLITNDTGARHVAAAFDVPVVTLFGSTDPHWTHIYYDRERIVRVDVPCAPCAQKVCPQPVGPLYHQCMTLITPEMVLSAARDLSPWPVGGRQEQAL